VCQIGTTLSLQTLLHHYYSGLQIIGIGWKIIETPFNPQKKKKMEEKHAHVPNT
jgi:hypothetical protein